MKVGGQTVKIIIILNNCYWVTGVTGALNSVPPALTSFFVYITHSEFV